ncbi:MAG: uncharacterized protein KVP18_003429 [Porospora cf. gigantea A]|uniref:uncharacterized protein n=2 Tax=Porospora cf. gigantea A TaxID=2853593 RepID=UPI00355A1745|nr:MAG: hypothetical protein KVP18_003429 [Porospora cf. gigantea A]
MSCDLQFCPECNNLLYPKECHERNQLMFTCHNCAYVGYPDPYDLVKNTVDAQTFNFRSKEDVHSYIAQGLADDPTLPREESWPCPQCQGLGAVYFQLPERVADDAMTLVFVCAKCTYYEVGGKEADDAGGQDDDSESEEPAEDNYKKEEEVLPEEDFPNDDIFGDDDDDDDLFGDTL